MRASAWIWGALKDHKWVISELVIDFLALLVKFEPTPINQLPHYQGWMTNKIPAGGNKECGLNMVANPINPCSLKPKWGVDHEWSIAVNTK